MAHPSVSGNAYLAVETVSIPPPSGFSYRRVWCGKRQGASVRL